MTRAGRSLSKQSHFVLAAIQKPRHWVDDCQMVFRPYVHTMSSTQFLLWGFMIVLQSGIYEAADVPELETKVSFLCGCCMLWFSAVLSKFDVRRKILSAWFFTLYTTNHYSTSVACLTWYRVQIFASVAFGATAQYRTTFEGLYITELARLSRLARQWMKEGWII